MFRSEYADVPPVDLPLHEAVLGGAARFGDTPALIDGTDGTTLTYAQVDRLHRRTAAALAGAGVRKGDVLALHSPNTLAFPVAFHAATRAGATVTTSHPLATAEEFARQVEEEWAKSDPAATDLPDTELARIRAAFTARFETLAPTSTALEAARASDPSFARFVRRNVHPHKAPGYAIVDVSLKKPGERANPPASIVRVLAPEPPSRSNAML